MWHVTTAKTTTTCNEATISLYASYFILLQQEHCWTFIRLGRPAAEVEVFERLWLVSKRPHLLILGANIGGHGICGDTTVIICICLDALT